MHRAVAGRASACFIGDDLGDLAAFDALDQLEALGADVVRVAVHSNESPEQLLARADVTLSGPIEVVEFLRALANAARAVER